MPITSRFVVRSTIVLLAIGFLTLLGIVGTTIWLGERAQIYFNEAIEGRDTRAYAVEVRNAVLAAETSQRGYIATGNEIYLAPYDSAKTLAQAQLNRLKRALVPYRESEAMVSRLDAVLAEKFIEMDQTIKLKIERNDDEALALLRTNRGKALMDEANVFLYGIILAMDERLTAGVNEQRANAAMLRWVSIIGGLIIVLVIAGATITVIRYTREVAQARDEVRELNLGLEERVKERTTDLARARDRAELLLAEVNHRIANSLSLVASLVKLQTNAVADPAAKAALEETQARISAVSLVHKRLYSAGDVRFVEQGEYLSSLLEHLAISMRGEGLGASLRHEIEPLKLPTDASINLGVVVTEWITNAFKYAYPEGGGEIRVRLSRLAEDRAELVVEDDGVGRNKAGVQGTGLGTRIVNAAARALKGDVEYVDRHPGTLARLTFVLQPA
ncbi:MAG: CHASE3 domain-containing protein [Pseudolabrys sp.]|nr:CHASE3 domain-containing protein [Pseudolabrys sp.]